MAGVLCAILLFAGIGSRNAPLMLRWSREKGFSHAYILSAGIAFMVLLNLLASTLLMQFGVGLPAVVRVVVVTALIAPLAFLMGMPFPIGMARLDATAPALLPWAWGVNACATVVGAVVAALLALHMGFTGVATLAILLYLSAASAFHGIVGSPKETGLLSA
jgi:hypothetical protein